MHEYCHRCGGDLPAGDGEAPFCPHCGAPQIYLLDYEQDAPVDGESTGALPPPRPQQIEWKPAIQCAVLVGGIAAVLSLVSERVPMLLPLSSLWTISGSLIALGLYQRRRPLAWMDAGVGARIGIVVGLSLAVWLGVSMAIVGLVSRFGLHTVPSYDAELTRMITQLQQTATANSQPAEVLRLFASSEFRAGMMLAILATSSFFLLLLSTAGGAVGGLMRTRRRASVG